MVITAPPGFGKSTTLNMIKRFMEITVNARGKAVNITTTENYKLFMNNNLSIVSHMNKTIIKQYFGKYPVIYIDYAPLRNIDSYADMVKAYKRIVSQTVSQHMYLLQSDKVSGTDKEVLQAFFNPELDKTLDEDDLRFSFRRLVEWLYEHFHKTVVILLDDHDAYLDSAVFKHGIEVTDIVEYTHGVLRFMLKGNFRVELAVMTGVFSVINKPRPYSQADLYFMRHYHFLDYHAFSAFYGLLESEVDQLATRFIENTGDRQKWKCNAKIYCNGYVSSGMNTSIYSWKILRYLQDGNIGSTGHCDRFERLKRFMPIFALPAIMERLYHLILGGEIYLHIPSSGTLFTSDVSTLNKMMTSRYVPEVQMDLFFFVLNEYGYLHMVAENCDTRNHTLPYDAVYARIPNLETILLFVRILREIHTNEDGVPETYLESLNRVLNLGFMCSLKDMIHSNLSNFLII